MKLGKILFLAILLFSGSMVLASVSLLQKLAVDSVNNLNVGHYLMQLEAQENLKKTYQREVLNDLNDFISGSLSKKDLAARLWNVRVPKEYQGFHFTLVTSFDDLSRSERLGEVRSRLEDLRESYAWISSAVSLIISNNF